MKKVLIISPYFPPSNTADMQRIRMSLPYFVDYGWEAEVVRVRDSLLEVVKDPLLVKSVPEYITIHEVNALSKKFTSKVGLGSIAIRSMPYYLGKVNQLLETTRYDLIYFSTTQYPLCILGSYWKKKFNIPFIIDMQDPWHSEYYQTVPYNERPKKYWFSYRLNKYLEPVAMKQCDGLISVSKAYITDLQNRYPVLKTKPSEVITFGAFYKDFEIVAAEIRNISPGFDKTGNYKHLVYIGRGGADLRKALEILFTSFTRGLKEFPDLFSTIKFHFIGTSYAPVGQGKETIMPIAEKFGVENYVFESTDRIPFYSGLASLKDADGLLIPGSNDSQYTASKLYPYIMSGKPILGIFHKDSNAVNILQSCTGESMITLDEDAESAFRKTIEFLSSVQNKRDPIVDQNIFKQYSANEMTKKQCVLFEKVINNFSQRV